MPYMKSDTELMGARDIASRMDQCPKTAAQIADFPQHIAIVDIDDPKAREKVKFATDVMALVPKIRAQAAQFRAGSTTHSIGHGKDVEGMKVDEFTAQAAAQALPAPAAAQAAGPCISRESPAEGPLLISICKHYIYLFTYIHAQR